MSNHNERNTVETILENAVALTSVKIPASFDNISQIDNLLISITEENGLTDFLATINNVFQIDKIKGNGEFAKGFPGIVLTAIVGRLINESYDPRNNFYFINPRPFFEQHIRPVLREKYHAPMGMSDPLNVAKNISIIDENWARGKRPEYASNAAAELIRYISQARHEELEKFLNVFVFIYLCLAKLYTAATPNITGSLNIQIVYELIQNLIIQAPAGGATAQMIVGSLLKAQHELFEKGETLFGIGESVNTTNTTSKKPGDFQEIVGENLHVYEITTKKVNEQRLVESSNAVLDYLRQSELTISKIDITFICRREDIDLPAIVIPDNVTILLTTSFNGLGFIVVDIWHWIQNMLERIGGEGRENVINQLNVYVGLPNTHLDVKRAWQEYSSRLTESG